MKHVALYLRVSTSEQTLDPQRLELREFCARRGWPVAAEFSDRVSGAKFTRSGLDELMRGVRKGKVDIVLCQKLDRLGRSLPHLAALIDEFTTHRVALVATSQGIDTSSDSPAGKLQLHILCAVAEFERSLIRERTCAGLKVARARGIRLGRPATLDAHRGDIARLRSEGLSCRVIAKELDIPVGSVFQVIREFRLSA
jgi:putative DNA-invertase from lambdoid prophage Rac